MAQRVCCTSRSTAPALKAEGELHACKDGSPKRRVWLKIYCGIDKKRLEIRPVEITRSHIGATPVLPNRLNQITAKQVIGSVTADGAYDTRKCHDAIAESGAHTDTQPGTNTKQWETVTTGAVAQKRGLTRIKIPRPCAVATI